MLSSSVRSIPRMSVCDNFLIKPLCVIARAFIADEIGRKRGTGDREKILRRASGDEGERKGARHLLPSSPSSLPPGHVNSR